MTGTYGGTGGAGSQGGTGLQGLTGLQGNTGLTGPTGGTGGAGSQGGTGLQGLTGLQGRTGLTGPTGGTGGAGAQGSTGLQGFTGLVGPGAVVSSSYVPVSNGSTYVNSPVQVSGGYCSINGATVTNRALTSYALTPYNAAYAGYDSNGNKGFYLDPNKDGNNVLFTSDYLVSGPYLPLCLSGRETVGDLQCLINGNIQIGNSLGIGTSPAYFTTSSFFQ